MANLTDDNLRCMREYKKCNPVQLGNLHQRMKYVMKIMQRLGPDRVGNELWHAVFDLQTEVQCFEPVSPPFGHRANKRLG